MLKIIVEKWDKNKDKLKEVFETQKGFNGCDYKEIVKTVFSTIYNDGECFLSGRLDLENLTEIDNGECQGTLIYLIPFDTYQPSESEYLMSYVDYDSCSGCDALQAIQAYGGYDKNLNETQVKDFMQLAKDILQNTIKPYNYGWREDENFKQVEVSEND